MRKRKDNKRQAVLNKIAAGVHDIAAIRRECKTSLSWTYKVLAYSGIKKNMLTSS